jgi:hypothetical protein
LRAWKDLENKGREAIRELIRTDRYYLLVKVLRRKDALHPWVYARCREVEAAPDGYIDIWAREHFKAVADSTPILTANRGWTTHGELALGDQVFSPCGKPVAVIALSERYATSKCYEVRFSTGGVIVADENHLWVRKRKIKRRVSGSPMRRVEWHEEIVTTSRLRGQDRLSEPEALQYPVAQLPLDPYLLGVWLGNGTRRSTSITEGIQDAEEMAAMLRSRGALVNAKLRPRSVKLRVGTGVRGNRTSSDFANQLRALGVYATKRIPDEYQKASIYQRMMLLRGLMDTDGTCNPAGTATFCNRSAALAKDVFDLACALGLKPRIRRHSLWLDSPKSENGRYWFWHVSFQAHTDRNPFWLKRKADRAIDPTHYRGHIYVRSVRPCETVPTRCIQVEGDGTYLAGTHLVPTHNSSIITVAGSIQEVLKDPDITIGIFSHTKPIAKAFLAQIKREFEANTVLKTLFPDVLYEDPERQSPSWSLDNGIIVKRQSNPNVATIEAHGLVDGQPTSKHYKLLLYDDVVTDTSVYTPEQIQKTTEAWSLSDNLGSIGGRKRYAGTRYSFADTYSEIIKKGAAIPRVYPATEDGTVDGKPVLFTPEAWEEKKKNQLESTLACQLLCNPIAGHQRMFDVEDLQVYEVRPLTLMAYLLVDPARSVKRDSANTAMVVLGVDSAANKYLLDGVDHKMDLMERWKWMRDLWAKWSDAAGVMGIRVGYERFGAIADLDYFKERQRVEGARFEITELEWPREGEGSKKDRVQRLVPDIRGHRFYLPYPTDDRRLTSVQQRMVAQGYEYRLSRQIRRSDENHNVYDLTERFRLQVAYFPFGGLKDLVDAASRIFDIDPVTPQYVDQSSLEPEHC